MEHAIRPVGHLYWALNALVEGGHADEALRTARKLGYVGESATEEDLKGLLAPLSEEGQALLNERFAGLGSVVRSIDASDGDEAKLTGFLHAIWPDVDPRVKWEEATSVLAGRGK